MQNTHVSSPTKAPSRSFALWQTTLVTVAGMAALALSGCDRTATSSSTAPAHAKTAEAAVDIATYKLRPTDTNQADAKAALAALDAEVQRLKAQASVLPVGEPRTAAETRISRIEERKKELERSFNKARLDALIDDVKAEWSSLTS